MNFMEKLTQKHKLELSTFISENNRKPEELKRAQAIILIGDDISKEMLLSLTNLQRTTIVKLRKLYLKLGLDALINKRKDKKPRDLLTKNNREEIALMLNKKVPHDFGWSGILHWSPSILGQLILELYGVKYKSKTSLYIIFKQSKITFHKPEIVYKNRQQSAIDEWKKVNEPIIEAAYKDSETIILVEDEMILTTQTTTQKIWLPEGQAHKIEHSNVRKRRSFYGFFDLKSGTQMAFKTERQTSEITAKCLKKVLEQYKGKKVLLFWDNAPWHKGEAMRNFLDTCSNFKIIPFPPYAPELNPQEKVWKAARANITHNRFIADIDSIARDVLCYLNNSIFKYAFEGFTA